ncbi:phosphate ABC transporter substrate-binding protein [Candidatus Bathyarchaeota archaeon]|nr:phosphate ABC transporter substrate-binding protein [Candidatus Bathyarchaeota archaeon]
MSHRRRSTRRNTITWTIIGVVVGLVLAGPLLYNGQISRLRDRIEELEGGAPSEPQGALTVAGSSTVLPITQEIANEFMAKYRFVEISVAGGGSGHGIKAAGSGEVDIGEASRNIKDSEYLSYPDLVAFSIGKDSVAVVVNPDNPLAGDLNLTLEEAARVFSGEIDDWSDLGGEEHVIEVYTREAGSGTREVFDAYVLEPYGLEFAGDAGVKPSNGEMRASVAGNKYGIAYISLGYVDETVTAIAVQGVEATVENVNSGDYPITRILWMFTNGMPDPLERSFIEFVRSEEGQAIVEDFGYIPIG